MKEYFRRLECYFGTMRQIHKAVWDITVKQGQPIIHYHIVGFLNWIDYKTAWTELHKAHSRYNQRIGARLSAYKRKRNNRGQFI